MVLAAQRTKEGGGAFCTERVAPSCYAFGYKYPLEEPISGQDMHVQAASCVRGNVPDGVSSWLAGANR